MIEKYDMEKISFFQNQIIHWGQQNHNEYPWRFTDNHWHALVAEIMLQRTNADQVKDVFDNFCSKYLSPEDYLQSNEKVFNQLGLVWREKTLKGLAERLVNLDNIPSDKNELLDLPGIGQYISGAYRSLHLGIRDYIIDSNIVRIYGRFFGFETTQETRRKKWFIIFSEEITPENKFKEYNYGLIDFTRSICKPKPECERCILKEKCSYFKGNSQL